MKSITPYLIVFSLTITLLTLVFRISLSYCIANELVSLTMLASFIYGALMFASGWFFGMKDREYLPIFDIGFRFHLAAYIIHNVISFLWLGLGFSSKEESFKVLYSIVGYWSVLIIIHFVFFYLARKRTIGSLNKDDIFE